MSDNLTLNTTTSSSQVLWYNYAPIEWVCITFVVLFSLSATLHAIQAIHFRLWWLLPTAVTCGISEIIGWSARLWSSKSPYLRTPFIMQISTTIIAPSFLIAANFIILARITRRLGSHFCRLSPIQYSAFFLACDIVALTIQAAGGGIASGTQPVLGAHIMLVGIAIQLRSVSYHMWPVVLTLYTALAAEFLLRYTFDWPIRRDHGRGDILPRGTMDWPIVFMIVGLSGMLMLVLLRSMYRMMELSGGWTGPVIATQWLFGVFDGGMIILAMFMLSLFHPGVLLRGPDKLIAHNKKVRYRAKESQSSTTSTIAPPSKKG